MVKRKIIIKAVLLDLDGVITNSMPYHFQSWKYVFKKIGLDLTHLDIYLREGQPGIISLREICKKYKKEFNIQEAKVILNQKELMFKKIVQPKYIAHSRWLISKLKRMGFRLGLVTGTARHEVQRMLPNNLINKFDVVITANNVKLGKPHPEPYEKAIRRLSCKSNQAVAIENAPFGIQSAKRAGLKCLAIETSLPKKYLKQADAVFHSIKHMMKHVDLRVEL